MKQLFFLSSILIFLSSCYDGTDMKPHSNKAGDTYCTYSATGAGSGAFTVCIFCPQGFARCGTLNEIRVLRAHHWLTPNDYDYYTLTSTGGECTNCSGQLYLERE
jgi:hypothetical protein